MRLLVLAVSLAFLLAAPYEREFAAKPGEPMHCHWCGKPLLPSRVYFDTDTCGRQWADQYAARGFRLTKEEIVAVR